MKIVFAASEAAPLVKTGGLGDVARDLPLALSAHPDTEVSVFLPFYGSIKEKSDVKTERIGEFYVDLSWRHQYVGLYRLCTQDDRLRIYLIDHEYYFKRERLYGYDDDGERFAYFSKAILESLVFLKECPDLIHCNDWQTALLPILLRAFYGEVLGGAKTVFTIHNIEYQGWAGPDFLGDVLGLGEEYRNTLEFSGCLNFMKGAILSADAFTTVSETYAKQICDAKYAHGLEQIIAEHAFKLTGIVNGIDPNSNSPEYDKSIPCSYGASDVSKGKKACKEELQKRLGLAVSADTPLVGLISRLVSHKGFDLLCAAAEDLLREDVQIVLLGTGEERFEAFFRELACRAPERVSANLLFSREFASCIYAASDLFLMPSYSEPCGLSQLIAMRFGSVPIVHATGGLKDTVLPYSDVTGEGVGFSFDAYETNSMMGCLKNALSLYRGNKDAWNRIVQNGMTADVSWNRSAERYRKLFSRLISPSKES
ncbi:MAG: glycogen synthase [Clostridia bacterium]|nr:glycogen synthase [Clostridia bacterium]